MLESQNDQSQISTPIKKLKKMTTPSEPPSSPKRRDAVHHHFRNATLFTKDREDQGDEAFLDKILSEQENTWLRERIKPFEGGASTFSLAKTENSGIRGSFRCQRRVVNSLAEIVGEKVSIYQQPRELAIYRRYFKLADVVVHVDYVPIGTKLYAVGTVITKDDKVPTFFPFELVEKTKYAATTTDHMEECDETTKQNVYVALQKLIFQFQLTISNLPRANVQPSVAISGCNKLLDYFNLCFVSLQKSDD